MSSGTVRQDSNCTQQGGCRWVISRRVFLKSVVGALAGQAVLQLSCTPKPKLRTVRFGIVTDCHYADTDTAGTRFYRESLSKLSECVALMNAEKVEFLIELGDFKDQDKKPVEDRTLLHLQNIEAVFQQFNGPTYHVLGNHDMDSISKQQFLTRVENTGVAAGRSYYAFDVNGLHCIVLDANYNPDSTDYDRGSFDWTNANIPAHELDWLKRDLAATRGPTVVFIHQQLDGEKWQFVVKNASDVRRILEESGKVLAVFQGHYHQGGYNLTNGIHYYTLQAMVDGSGQDNNSYAVVEVRPDLNIIITGYHKATSRELGRSSAART